MKKIGVVSITLDRLYYTYHCFKALKKRAGCKFEHIIIDNYSTDGTYEYLKEEGFNVIRNKKNEGISYAVNQGINWLKDKDVDIIIKIDNDCEIITQDIFIGVSKFFEETEKDKSKYSVSLSVKGLGKPPKIFSEEKIRGFNFGRVHYIGGIFRAMRKDDWIEAQKNLVRMNDKAMNDYFQEKKFKIGYLTDFEANHFETTKGQEIRYNNYFSKEYKY